MSGVKAEVNLLIFAASEIPSGLALTEKLCDTNGYRARFTVLGDATGTLRKQFETQLAASELLSGSHVDSRECDADSLVIELDRQRGLRLVLVAGLDQIDEFRKTLLRKCRRCVACFEPHSGLQAENNSFCIVRGASSCDPTWFCSQLQPYPSIHEVFLPDLDARHFRESHSLGDWVLLACTPTTVDSVRKAAKKAIESAIGPVLLVRNQKTGWGWFWQTQLPNFVARRIPQMERGERQELASHLETYSKLDFEFVALICASTFLAAFGLLQNSAAVIIGAMLVAPLMTPILGAGLSLTHGNRPLFWSSLRTILLGFLAAICTSCFFGLLVRFLVPDILNQEQNVIRVTQEMWSRTHPTALDFLVGLVGGSAAAFARTRTHLADALAGAAIAAALVPPIATAGLHVAFLGMSIMEPSGDEAATNLMYGPILLFVANMLTIMIGSSFVLWSCGVRASHGHGRREKWGTRMTFLLIVLSVAILVWVVQHP